MRMLRERKRVERFEEKKINGKRRNETLQQIKQ